MIKRAWGLFVIMWISSVALFAAQLNNISVSQQAGQTTLYITINGPFTHRLFTLTNPNRVVLDLNSTKMGVNVNRLGLINSMIKQVRSGSPNAQSTRLVLDLNQQVQVRSAPWQYNGSVNGLRLDLIGSDNGRVVSKAKSPVINKPLKPVIKQAKAPIKNQPVVHKQPIITHQQPIKVPHSPSNKYLRDVIVVLDAGHGGKDPGAKGPRRSQEKNVVLAITLKLKQLIDRQPGMRAVLTRSGDYYVGLRERLEITRKYNGDVFVSIHADAFNNPHSNGASVFALSQSGATSEAARWIAEKENYSELGGVNLGDLDDSNGVVRSVLIDLSQTATINSALQMGGRVLGQLSGFTALHNNKVEQARFVVLKSPDIPSILVETGFISNPREESNLTNSAYQNRLSQAIFQGVKAYFWENPPHGSRIEAMINNKFHIVKAGETLPQIAARYHTSVHSIQTMNHLSGKTNLRPGQRLVVSSSWA
ncbi:N-acetylmuramoyl-L-alanine amidase family protein [Legionella fallonii]|uniref:N-acetylmuramoyl-L-alanine amidase AmiC n=1 Tax=Legionella fallonii LLAP-10 TaxID=1212491 RepID=A0A098G1H4_9GAMM|nr:N-acetylmuramoyl-L-alanine amidase [Legionella fallonii]CEG55836.1 N-acetylmuramoyl-L-alanine amidase [Legionella fallonii LLAP-10]